MSFCPIIQSNCRENSCEFYNCKSHCCLLRQSCQVFVDKHIVDDGVKEVLETLSSASLALIEPADVEYIEDYEADDKLWLYDEEDGIPEPITDIFII